MQAQHVRPAMERAIEGFSRCDNDRQQKTDGQD
jgi:hypothetical protein